MFQLVSVCKLTNLHWPKPKIISMPVIDARHKTDKRYLLENEAANEKLLCTCDHKRAVIKQTIACIWIPSTAVFVCSWMIDILHKQSHVFPCLQVRYCVCFCRMLEESVSGSQGETHGERSAGRKEVTADERPALLCKSTASSHLVKTLNWNTPHPVIHNASFHSIHTATLLFFHICKQTV